ncbi:uncharacterized protein N7484_010367 [Penicillium longicatenatum]|uniref:uncharacterized protein n=1 Tax=Penicillium longicatenatum TaxID=1561947 RepID=UPI0025482E2F|nr:uncharacterized protein N7484_010367 [Penicillium longicatenatum]KAJ5630267.1 hypothetical protein N7484_010367 [Penicillium longicatenatum]
MTPENSAVVNKEIKGRWAGWMISQQLEFTVEGNPVCMNVNMSGSSLLFAVHYEGMNVIHDHDARLHQRALVLLQGRVHEDENDLVLDLLLVHEAEDPGARAHVQSLGPDLVRQRLHADLRLPERHRGSLRVHERDHQDGREHGAGRIFEDDEEGGRPRALGHGIEAGRKLVADAGHDRLAVLVCRHEPVRQLGRDDEDVLVGPFRSAGVLGDDLDLHWRKKARDIPVHALYETYTEDVSLFLNFLTFFLPMASADNAFRDYASVGDILDRADAYTKAIPSGNKILEVIHFTESVHEIPVFRQYRELHVEKYTDKARGADAFGKALVELGHRSGYTRNITIRSCRRWALMEADKGHSKSARMRFAGQTNRDTYGRFYAHPVSGIDGPANYLGVTSRSEHIQNRRGMGIYQDSHLLQSLPAKAEFEFQDRSDVRALDEELRSLSAQPLSPTTPVQKHEIQIKQKLVYSKKRWLYKEELNRIRGTQSNKLKTPNENQATVHNETLFYYRRRVMPQRDLLANIFPREISLRHQDGRRAIEALESLCKDKCPVAYRASIRPRCGKCPCGKPIDG